jgi:hypothetical protein
MNVGLSEGRKTTHKDATVKSRSNTRRCKK